MSRRPDAPRPKDSAPRFELPEAIINPRPARGEAPVSERVILTFARPDYELLCRLVQAPGRPRYLWDCAFRQGRFADRPVTVVAPAMGAPYAVMVLERLIALGARLVLALGWCGSMQSRVAIGDLVLPTAAVSGEGTSGYYGREEDDPAPHPALLARFQERLEGAGIVYHAGPIWTTDAIFRETPDLISHFQARGLLAVDLEMAALFQAARFRRIPLAGLLVVSDELATLSWRHGLRSEELRRGRELAAGLMLETAAQGERQDA